MFSAVANANTCVVVSSVFAGCQIPYPKREFLNEDEPEEKTEKVTLPFCSCCATPCCCCLKGRCHQRACVKPASGCVLHAPCLSVLAGCPNTSTSSHLMDGESPLTFC